MTFTYYGHSSFLVESNGYKLLFDPFITPNEMAAGIVIDDIEADFIFITHGHNDHVADALSIAKRTGATLICGWEVMSWLNKNGIENVHPMNIGGASSFDFGKVKCTVAQHSSVMPDGSNGGNPLGFIVYLGEQTFYYSGDTGLTLDMQLIPLWAKLDFAVLPIGDHFTMGYEDAALAAGFVKTTKVVGVHYDTFGWIKIDHNAATKAFADKGIELLLPTIGETIGI
ncbi:MAG: metal-dependent hydrolase [Chitinophagaceae bacterium]